LKNKIFICTSYGLFHIFDSHTGNEENRIYASDIRITILLLLKDKIICGDYHGGIHV